MPLIVDKGQGELQSIKSRQRTGRISIDGNLSQCKYLLIVEGFTPSCTASSFFEILLVKIASLKFFCISVIVIIENY